MQRETFPSHVTRTRPFSQTSGKGLSGTRPDGRHGPTLPARPSSLVSGVRVQPVSQWNAVPSPIWHRMDSQNYSPTVRYRQVWDVKSARWHHTWDRLTALTQLLCQLWLSLCDSPNLIYSLGLSLPEMKSLIAMYHISCMDLKKTNKNNPNPTHAKKEGFKMPGIYCTLHLGFFKCSFVCCLNALCFDCVRLCWLAIAKLIKFPEERLLRAPSCKGLWGQVLAKLMGSQQRSLCRTRGNNPSRLPPLYCTLWVCLAAVWWAGACCVWKYRMQLWVYSLFYS